MNYILKWHGWTDLTHWAVVILFIYIIYMMVKNPKTATINNLLLLLIALSVGVLVHQNINKGCGCGAAGCKCGKMGCGCGRKGCRC